MLWLHIHTAPRVLSSPVSSVCSLNPQAGTSVCQKQRIVVSGEDACFQPSDSKTQMCPATNSLPSHFLRSSTYKLKKISNLASWYTVGSNVSATAGIREAWKGSKTLLKESGCLLAWKQMQTPFKNQDVPNSLENLQRETTQQVTHVSWTLTWGKEMWKLLPRCRLLYNIRGTTQAQDGDEGHLLCDTGRVIFLSPYLSLPNTRRKEMEVNIEPLPLDIGRVSSALHPKPVVCQNTSAS